MPLKVSSREYWSSQLLLILHLSDTLDKSKVTGVAPVDKLQDGVNSTLSGQVGQGGLFQPVGDAASKEGVNRAERGGKDDSGSYIGAAGGKASEYGQGAAGALGNAGSSVGSSVTGILGGGGNKNEEGQGEQAQKK